MGSKYISSNVSNSKMHWGCKKFKKLKIDIFDLTCKLYNRPSWSNDIANKLRGQQIGTEMFDDILGREYRPYDIDKIFILTKHSDYLSDITTIFGMLIAAFKYWMGCSLRCSYICL